MKHLDQSLDLDKWPAKLLDTDHQQPEVFALVAPPEMNAEVIYPSGNPVEPLDPPDNDFVHLTLSDTMNYLFVSPDQKRFFGKSSGALLIHKALHLKYESTNQGDDGTHRILHRKRPEFWTTRPVRAVFKSLQTDTYRHHKWEELSSLDDVPSHTFPDEDLLYSLVDLYFSQINLFLPLLHRPTFEKSINAGLHWKDSRFGEILLLVCALGSKYSEDSRTLLDDSSSYLSAGWKWFSQVQMVQKSFLIPPTLCDLQFHCVSSSYVHITYVNLLGVVSGAISVWMFNCATVLGHDWYWYSDGARCGCTSEEGQHR